VSQFFGDSEFTCHDGTPVPPEWLDDRLRPLEAMLDKIRIKRGGPVRVISGYRTEAYNERIGGAKLSQHVQARAADVAPITAAGLFSAELSAFYVMICEMLAAGELPELGGLGWYPGKWVHLDIRPRPPSGHVASWQGTGIGSEQA
jgi:uncharacterized protein YcbK (DUF882 family)